MLTVVRALFRFLSTLFDVVSVAPVTIGIILLFTLQSLLRSGCQILAFMHCLLVLLYSHVSRHCDIYQQCRLVLYVCSIWSSVFSHMICLDTYIAVDFDFLPLSLSLVQPHVGTIVLNAAGHTSHTVCSGQLRQLCHVSSYTPVVPACCIHSLSARLSLPSASRIAFLFVCFHFDDASS